MQRKLTRVRAISSECRSNGHRWNAAIFTGRRKLPRGPTVRTHFLTQSATRRARQRGTATRRFHHFHGHSVKDWKEGTLEFLSVIPGPDGTKGAYFTSTRTRRYQDRPNPQGRLLAERNPKLNGVSEGEFSCG